MEQLEDLFRSSIETDRNFPVQPMQWQQLERELDRQERLAGRYFLQIFLVVLFTVLCQFIPGSDHHLPALHSFPIYQMGSASGPGEVALLEDHTLTDTDRYAVAGEPLSAASMNTGVAERIENRWQGRQRSQGSTLQKTAVVGADAGRDQRFGDIGTSKGDVGFTGITPQEEPVATEEGLQSWLTNAIATDLTTTGEVLGESVDPSAEVPELFSDPHNMVRMSATSPGRTGTTLSDSVSKMTASGTAIGLLLPPNMTPHPVPERRSASNWQLSLQFGGLFDNTPRNIDYYTAGSGGGQLTQIYSFPSGDTTRLYFNGRILEKQSRIGLRTVRLGLQRVFGSGFGTRIGFLYASGSSSTEDLTTLVPGFSNVFYFYEEYESSFMLAELGVNYTLMRERRLQPFFGLVSILNFSTATETRRFAQYPERDYRQLEHRAVNRSRQLTPGLYLELGAQWLLTDRWSIGANLAYVTTRSAADASIGGLGLEIRYRW